MGIANKLNFLKKSYYYSFCDWTQERNKYDGRHRISTSNSR